MRLLLLVAFLLTVTVFCTSEGFKFPLTSRHPLAVTRYVMKSVREMAHEVKRERRQSFNQKCIQDATEATRNPFSDCESKFEAIDNEQGEENVNLYCRHNCSKVMLDLFLRIKQDCGANAHHIDNSLLIYLNYSCDHDPLGHYCLYDWYNGDNLFPESDKNAYQNCADTYTSGTCPTDCKTALTDINRGFGCCYTVFYQATPTHQSMNGTSLIPISAFADCRLTAPPYCTS